MTIPRNTKWTQGKASFAHPALEDFVGMDGDRFLELSKDPVARIPDLEHLVGNVHKKRAWIQMISRQHLAEQVAVIRQSNPRLLHGRPETGPGVPSRRKYIPRFSESLWVIQAEVLPDRIHMGILDAQMNKALF